MASSTLIDSSGFATFDRVGRMGVEALECALDTGYRHFDTAQSYDSETEVGVAVQSSGIERNELFITTKISAENYGQGKLVPSLQQSLEKLQLDCLDLTLIHRPSPNNELPLLVYLEQLAEAQQRGLTRFIGVSNFTIALLVEAFDVLGKGGVTSNQVELNPLFQNKKLAKFCLENNVAITCYQPLAQGRVNEDPVLQSLAKRYQATPAQVALAWGLACGYSVIPTFSCKLRIQENFAASELLLSVDDLSKIAKITPAKRSINSDWGPEWD